MTPRRTVLSCLILGFVLLAGSAAAEQCASNSDCPDRSCYCRKNGGACEGEGECARRPEMCTDVFEPVCGCDGETYGNACAAAVAAAGEGVAAASEGVARQGECDEQGCGSNQDCDEDEFCNKRIGDCEGAGRCVQRPEICTAVLDPACGCDGQTYSIDDSEPRRHPR